MKKIKFNVPTKLTFVRLILSLIIIILLIFPFYRVGITFPQFLFKNILIDLRYLISGVLFIIASITDYYDGKLARKNNEVTNFGKLVDAIADKVLVNPILVILACNNFIPAIIPVIYITRDIIVDAIKMQAASKGRVVAAIKSGKLKTACMMIGLVLVFFYNMPFEFINIRVDIFLLGFACVLSVISCIQYFVLNKGLITE